MTDAPNLPDDKPTPSKRVTKAELEQRERQLEEREAALAARESELEAKGIDANPAPVQPVSDAREHKADNPRAIREQISTGKKFPDLKPYLDKYGEEKQLFWINDMSGDVQRWIDAGAEPVPVLVNKSRQFEGLTDRHESQWVRVVGGPTPEGGVLWVYLLMMDRATYESVANDPLKRRQEEIRKALKRGQDRSDGAGGELQSYAPHLPTGGQGFQQITDAITGRD